MNDGLQYLKPEGALALGILAMLLADLLSGPTSKARVAVVGILSCLAALMLVSSGSVALGDRINIGGQFCLDSWVNFARVGILSATALTLSVAPSTRAIGGRIEAGEYYVLLASLGLGAMLFAGATNLLSIYLSMEFMSLCSYVLAGLHARDRNASEAGLKYVLFGGLASAFTLFGMSYLYGVSGSLELEVIGQRLANNEAPVEILAPLALVGIGYAYKLALAPFHYWSPDVYEGSPTISTAVFSVVPKIAAFIGLAHALTLLFPKSGGVITHENLSTIIAVIAILTMTAGNLSALAQTNAKRLLAYSSIAHAGYMVLALACGTSPYSMAALIFYLTVYLFMNLGAFFAIALLEDTMGGSDLSKLAGSRTRNPWLSLSLAIVLFALMGLPPLTGFFAKWILLREVVRAGMEGTGHPVLLMAAALVLINSGIAAFAYLKIIRAIMLEPRRDDAPEYTGQWLRGGAAVVVACAGISVLLGLYMLQS